MMDLPGIMARGNWTAALFVDDKAPIQAVKGLTRIFTGRVGGTTHLLSILVGQFLGVHQVPISLRDARRHPHRQPREIWRRRHHAGARQAEGRERGDPQQPILGRPRRHRLARRQVALPRLRAQLEFGRPLGRDRQARLGQRISGDVRKRPRFRHPRVHRERGGAGAAGADLRDRRALGGDVLLPRPRAHRRRRRRAAGARLRRGGSAAALVGRDARYRGRFRHLRLRAGLCHRRQRAAAGGAGDRRPAWSW